MFNYQPIYVLPLIGGTNITIFIPDTITILTINIIVIMIKRVIMVVSRDIIHDLLKSVELWFFDRLLFDAEQMKWTEDLKECLNTELADPKMCYLTLIALDHSLVGDMNNCFNSSYIFQSFVLKRLFKLGWDQKVDVYLSIPFTDVNEFEGYDVDSMINELADVNNSTYFSRTFNRMVILAGDHEVKNKRFYDLFETITNKLQKEFDEHLAAVNSEYFGSDEDEDEDEDEQEIDEDDYSQEDKVIGKFHAAMDDLYDGFSDDYITSHPLYAYYLSQLDEFIDDADIKTVTTELDIDDRPTVSRDTVGLSLRQIVTMFRVYRLKLAIDDITFENGNIHVTTC
jgi:hypothetical protein